MHRKTCVLVLLFYFAILPARLICLIWMNCPGTEFVGTALKFRERKGFSSSCVLVLQKPLTLVISRRCFVETAKKCTRMYNAHAKPVF